MEYYDEEEEYFPPGLEHDFPEYTEMCVGEDVFPRTDEGWDILGDLIGEHTHLTKLTFCDIYTIGRVNFEYVMRGVARNRSLHELHIVWCNGVWGSVCQILAPFFKENDNLSKFTISLCDRMHPAEVQSLSSTFSGQNHSISLKVLDLSQNNITDDMAKELIPSLESLLQLRELNLRNNCIGTRECDSLTEMIRIHRPTALQSNHEYMELMSTDGALDELREQHQQYLRDNNNVRNGGIDAIASLLSGGHPSLQDVNLGKNNIDDKGAEVLASGLSQNNILKRLSLSDINMSQGGRNRITEKGWGYFAQSLGGNGSTIKETYHANHTLVSLTDANSDQAGYANDGFDQPLTDELESLLQLNDNEDKKVVARQKVILVHHVIGNSSIDKFDEPAIELKLLPGIIAWIGKGSSSLNGVFEFCRTNPSLCE